ncbi:MAG: mechanosensitive ion channel domain-containing protein [Thermoplasmata archaeon]
MSSEFDQVLVLVAGSVIIVAIVVIFFELILRILARILRQGGTSPSSIHTIAEVVRIVYVIIAVIAVATWTGLANTLTVLTLSGIAGLVVSLALQPTLTNMISGYYLIREDTAHVGDSIVYGAVTGTVIRVALRNTWILTENGEVAIIANTTLYNGPLINTTRSAAFAHKYRSRD